MPTGAYRLEFKKKKKKKNTVNHVKCAVFSLWTAADYVESSANCFFTAVDYVRSTVFVFSTAIDYVGSAANCFQTAVDYAQFFFFIDCSTLC